MSGNLQDLRRRLKSVRNTQKITQAMKTVSAAKLRRSVTHLNQLKPYSDGLRSLLVRCGHKGIDYRANPFLSKRTEGLYVVVCLGSDKGLCGAFNTRIFRLTQRLISTYRARERSVDLICLGQKTERYFSRRGETPSRTFSGWSSGITEEDARNVSDYLKTLYLEQNICQIILVSSVFSNASDQPVRMSRLFPLPVYEVGGKQGETGPNRENTIFEPDAAEMFAKLLPPFIDTLVYRVLLESLASEHRARMVAMDLATKNAQDIIKRLTPTLNKLRQTIITNELLEIITATEALK